ncbi:MAG: TolC family protein [Deltaproteobacteria bacterium]|nr:TolC family protein [Deltaproteobacteria bacterium]
MSNKGSEFFSRISRGLKGNLPWVLIGLAVSASQWGCARDFNINRPLPPGVHEKLRKATTLQEEHLLKRQVKLDEVPPEHKGEIFERAETIAVDKKKPETREGGSKTAETLDIELPEALKVTVENNLGLQTSAFNPAIAEQNLRVEQAKYEAVLAASTVYTKTNTASSSGSGYQPPGSGSIVNTHTYNFTPTVKIPAQSGGTVNLNLPSYTRVNTGAYGTFSPATTLETPAVGFGLTQPLLRGGGFKVTNASIETAKLKLLQSDSALKLATIRLLANVEQAYWDYYGAYENLKIEVAQYDRARQQANLARRLVEEGVRTKVEMTRAETGVARQFQDVLLAEGLRRRTENNLKRLMNRADLPLESETIIIPKTGPRLEGLFFDRVRIIELALQNRMELLDNELQQAIDRVAVFMNKNAVLPNLLFNFNYSYSGSKPKFGDALDQLLNDYLTTYNFSLTAELPLQGNRAAKAKLRASVLSQQQNQANRKVLEQSIKQEVLDALDAAEKNWQRILANRTAVMLASETYESEIIEFQNGFSTSTDVLTALTTMADAETALVAAIVDHQKALVDIAFATGTVFGSGGVVWIPGKAAE